MQNHGTPMNGAMMNGQQPRMRNPMQGNRTDELNALNIFTNYLTRQQSQVHFTVIIKSAGVQQEQARNDQWSKMIQTAIDAEANIFKRAPDAGTYEQEVKNKMKSISNISNGQQLVGGMRPPPVMQQPYPMQQQQRLNGGMSITPDPTTALAPVAPMFASNVQPQMHGYQQDMYNPHQTPAPSSIQQGQQRHPNSNQIPSHSSRQPLSQEDQQYIAKLTHHLMQQSQTNGTLQNLQSQINTMPPEERNKLGPNPIKTMFQRKAIGIAMQRKAQQAGQTQNLQLNHQTRQQQDQSMNGSSNPAANHMRRTDGGATVDPSQFAGLQEQAMRSQASGDLVVPATNNQFPYGRQPGFQTGLDPAHQTFQQSNGPVRHTIPGQSMAQGQTSEQAAARALAQAHMSQSNLPPQRTPQQERLHGQGLHTSQPGQQPSPLALLNRPLQDQNLRTPQSSHTIPNQSLSSTMQQTPQTGSEGRPNAQEHAQSQMNGYVLKLPPQLQHVYHTLAPKARTQLAGMDAFQLQKILTGYWNKQHQSMPDHRSGQGNPQRETFDHANGGQMKSQGPGMFQQQKLNQASQLPQGLINNHPGSQNVGQSMPNINLDALRLPREKINMHFPGLQIPFPVQNWGNFMHWIKESNSIPRERYPELARIRQAQLQQLTENYRTGGARESAALPSTMNNDKPIEELLKDPVFLGTPQIDLDPASVARRPVVRTGLVPVLGGSPQMPIPGPHDMASAREATNGMPDSEIARHLRNRRLQQIREVDPDMWRELHRSEHLRSMHTPPNNHTHGQFQGNTAGTQFQQPSLGSNSRGINQQARRSPAGGPADPMNNMPIPAKGPNSQLVSEKLGQNSNQFSADVGKGQTSLNSNGPTSEQWVRMNPEQQKQRETERMQYLANPSTAQKTGTPSHQGSRPLLNQQLSDDFKRFSEVVAQDRHVAPFRQCDAEEAEQFRLEIQKNNLQELFGRYARLVPLFFGRFWSSKPPNTAALNMLKGVMQSAHLVQNQDFRNQRYNVTIHEFREHIDRVKKCVNSMTSSAQNGQQQAKTAPPQSTVVQNEQVQPKSSPQSSSRRDSKSNVPPPAPTVEKAPYSFDTHTSPHGTPRYGTNSTFDPTKIAIPQERQNKRKHGADSAKATPVLQQAKPQEVGKVMPPQKTSQTSPAIRVLPFKCPIPRCDREKTGFATQEDADKHAKEAHNFKGDELDWCLDMLRGALNLNAAGQPKPKSNIQSTEPSISANTALTTTGGSNAKPDLQNAAVPVESAAAAWKRQQAQRMKQTAPSVASQNPKSNVGAPLPMASTNKAVKVDPAEAWKNSKLQIEELRSLFSDLEDFPAKGLDAFAGIEVDVPGFSADEVGFTLKSLEAHALAQQKAALKFGEVLRIRREDYCPFPQLNGGIDPYEGRTVEIIEDDEPFVPVDPDEFIKNILDPEKMKEMQAERNEEARRREKDNWMDMWNPQFDDFFHGDGDGDGQDDEDRGYGTPPKRLKRSLEWA